MVKGQKILNATVVVFLTLSSLSIGFIVGVGVNNPIVVRNSPTGLERATDAKLIDTAVEASRKASNE